MDVPARVCRWPLAGVPGFFLLLLLAGCETNVDPFAPTDLAFTVFGYLDAGADTQYVRVTPLRRHLYPGTEPLGAVVTVENVATGAATALRDSLFRYHPGLVVHNFWTPLRVHPGETYRLTFRQDGKTATVTVAMPADRPEIVVEEESYGHRYIRIRGAVRVVAVELRYDVVNVFTGGRTTHRFDLLEHLTTAPDGFVFGFRESEMLPQLGSVYAVEAAYVTVAAGSPDWPDVAGLDLERQALPQTFDNVEGGLGYVGGVVSKTLKWK